MTPFVIIGNGHWGTALAAVLKKPAHEIHFIDAESSNSDWKRAFKIPPVVVLACPFQALPEVLRKLESYEISAVINASKGIDRKSLLTFSGLAKKRLRIPIATLSGPTFAKEVLEKKPTACVLAGRNLKFLKETAKKFSTPYFRIYVSLDPVGVEASGAMKNVLAIACGVSDGLHLGLNARAALLTRGIQELSAVVERLGGKASTVFGLAGIGDLWLTATGDLSRNRQLGLQLAKGLSLEKALSNIDGICEGLYTVEQAHRLAKKYSLDLPISEQVYGICFGKQSPAKALQELMSRELKLEEPKLRKVR